MTDAAPWEADQELSNAPWLADQEAPSLSSDLLQSIPADIKGAASSFGGWPGDLREGLHALGRYIGVNNTPEGQDWLSQADSAISNKLGLNPNTKILNPLTSQDITQGLDTLTGGPSYQPKTTLGKDVLLGSQLLPAMMGGEGSVPAKLATNVVAPVAAKETASQLSDIAGVPEDYKPWFETAAMLFAPYPGNKLRAALTNKDIVSGIPTTQNLKDATDDIYNKARSLGVTVTPQAYQQFATNLQNNLTKSKAKLDIANTLTAGKLQTVMDDASLGKPQTLDDLQTIKQIGGDLMNSNDGTTIGLGKTWFKTFKDWEKNLGPNDFSAANGMPPRIGLDLWNLADQKYSQYKKSQLLDNIMYVAQNKAGASYTATGAEGGIRQGFNNLANQWVKPNHGDMRWFSPDEQQEILAIDRGAPVQNFLRRVVGKMGITNSFSHFAATNAGLIAHMLSGGNPGITAASVGLPYIIGTGAHLLSGEETAKAAEKFIHNVRAGQTMPWANTSYPGLLAPLALDQLGTQQPQ